MKFIITSILTCVGMLWSVTPLGDTESGVNALGRGQYEEALAAFRPGAQQGNRSDQIFLAHTYTLLEKYEEAYAWYHLSAACGSIDAEIELAVLTRKISEKTIEAGRKRGDAYVEMYCFE